MRKVKVSAIQIKVSNCLEDNLKKVETKIREAAQNGANIILLQNFLRDSISVKKEDMSITLMLRKL